jgi:hypothetical protein
LKNRDIYESALRILAQSAAAGENTDFEERAPYLIASFCADTLELNRHLCEAAGKSPLAGFEKVWISLEENFPLIDRLAPIACLYLAAMLILDEDGEISDKLYARYCDKITEIWQEIPAVIEKIKEKYFSK